MSEPAWTGLERDLHLRTLNLDYAPTGLLEMIAGAPRTVLDVGCFCGGSGRWLRRKFPAASLIGIEMIKQAAALAAGSYDRVINARFEDIDFTAEDLRDGRFDAIIAADVLEHMVNPWKALQRLRPLVADGGALYASIPNVRNLRVILDLAAGKWSYAGSGILDVTHLRFFTRQEIDKLFAETGWLIEAARFNPDPQLAQAFAGRDLASLNAFSAGNLAFKNLTPDDLAELTAQQFYVKAQPTRLTN